MKTIIFYLSTIGFIVVFLLWNLSAYFWFEFDAVTITVSGFILCAAVVDWYFNHKKYGAYHREVEAMRRQREFLYGEDEDYDV